MPIESTQPVIIPLPASTLPTPSANSAASIILPAPGQSSGAVPGSGGTQVGFDAPAAEQKRLEAVQQKSQDIANTRVLGDSTFTLFKDVTGQLITRFTNRDTGKVTYVPQPQIFKMGGGDDSGPMVKITA